MTQSKHTPAPWYVKIAGKNWFVESEGRQITCADEIDREDTANANLIAAAPELLEALENIIDDQYGTLAEIMEPWKIEDAKQAIKKARGEL